MNPSTTVTHRNAMRARIACNQTTEKISMKRNANHLATLVWGPANHSRRFPRDVSPIFPSAVPSGESSHVAVQFGFLGSPGGFPIP